jgi:hypothetical protein
MRLYQQHIFERSVGVGEKILEGAGAIAALVFVGLQLLLFVGGVSYRKDCIRQDGTVTKSWTFTWFAPVPYLFRPSQEGCEVHTGARVALNAVGLAKFHQVSVSSAAREAAKDMSLNGNQRYFAELYADLKDLQDWNKAHPNDMPGAVQHLRQVADQLEHLRAPSVVAEDHSSLVGLFRDAAGTGQRILSAVNAGNRAAVERLAPKLQSANTRQQELLQSISTKLAGG